MKPALCHLPFPGAARRRVQLEGLEQQTPFSPSSGGWESEIEVSAGWFLLEAPRENLPHVPLQLLVTTNNPWCVLAYRHTPLIHISVAMWASPVCLFGLLRSSDLMVIRSRPTFMQHGPRLTWTTPAETIFPIRPRSEDPSGNELAGGGGTHCSMLSRLEG